MTIRVNNISLSIDEDISCIEKKNITKNFWLLYFSNTKNLYQI